MARIRSIKPTIWGDESFIRLSRDARLLLLGLISNADDEGRFVAAPSHIAAAVFPHEEIRPALVRRWLEEITAERMVILYEVGNRSYGYFPKWRDHQKVNRPYPSLLPSPPDALNDSVNGSHTDSVTDSSQKKKGRTEERKNGGTEELKKGSSSQDGPSTSRNETRVNGEGPSPEPPATPAAATPAAYPNRVADTVDELVDQIHVMRPGWRPQLIRRPIERQLAKGVSLHRAALAAYAVAADPTSLQPIRLDEPGWWWDESDTRRRNSDAQICTGAVA